MNQSKPLHQNKCVITFYSVITKNQAKLTPIKAWQKIISPKPGDVISCRNVFEVDMSANNLREQLPTLLASDNNLRDDIVNEWGNNCADFMFIQPLIGTPIDFFNIKTLLSEANQRSSDTSSL